MFKWYISVCVLSILVYLNTLRAGFVYDDNRAIISNQDIRPTTELSQIFLNDFWGTPISSSNSHGSYRPLCVLTFRLNYLVWGLQPLGYHLVNIILHCIATGLVLHVGSLLLPGKCSVLAAAMFAVHPVHTEAVAGIVGRADLLACVFYLLCFIVYVRHVEVRTKVHLTLRKIEIVSSESKHWPKQNSEYLDIDILRYKLSDEIYPRRKFGDIVQHFNKINRNLFVHYVYLFLSLCFAVCSTLCKETGITILGICAVYEMSLRRGTDKRIPSSKISLLALAVTTLLILVLRLHLTGLKTPTFSSADNPTAHDASILTRTLTFLYLPLINFWLLLYPKCLSFDWSMDAVPKITTWFDARNILTISFYFILYRAISTSYCRLLKRTKVKTVFRKPKLNCFECHQSLNTVHTSICHMKNNNNTPSACFCSITSDATFDVHTCILTCFSFMVLPFIPATNLLFYVGFVVAERVLYLPSIGFSFLFALGLNLFYNKINKIVSVVFVCIILLTYAARTVQRNEDWKDEESLYRSGIPINPPKAYGNLGSILSTLGRLEEAEVALRLALLYRPNMADVHYNLGNLQARLKRYSDAIQSYENAIRLRPSLAVSYSNLGHLLATLGHYTEAEEVLIKCINLKTSGLKDVNAHQSAQASAMLHLSRLYFDKGNLKEAVEFYTEAMRIKARQDISKMMQSLEMSSLALNGLHKKEERLIRRTVNPDNLPTYSSYEKYLINNSSRLIDRWFRETYLSKLNHPATFMKYGKFLVDSGRYKEAVNIYLEAYQLGVDQYNVVTSAAAALRYAERFEEAEIFYRKAVSIKPHDATSLSNLGAILHLIGTKIASPTYGKMYFKEADSCYREALKLNPEDDTALVNLSKLRNYIKHRIS